jgi:hypothetical protein
VQVAAEAARRFLVQRQLLAPARALDGRPKAVLEVFRRLGSVQFDPDRGRGGLVGRANRRLLHAHLPQKYAAGGRFLDQRLS